MFHHCAAADEVLTEILVIGVTDGITSWLVLISRYYVAPVQWEWGVTYDGPMAPTANSPYAFTYTNQLSTQVEVSSLVDSR